MCFVPAFAAPVLLCLGVAIIPVVMVSCVNILTSSLLVLLLVMAKAQACTIKVQVNDFPPFSDWLDGRWQGSRVVLAERLAVKLRCKTHYLDVAWGCALLLMQQGELHLIFHLTKTKEREAFMLFLSAHYPGTWVLAVTQIWHSGVLSVV